MSCSMQNNSHLFATDAGKVGLIRNAFYKIFCDYRPEKHAWFPFLDQIVLLLQMPVGLSIFEKPWGHRPRLVGTTINDIELYQIFDPLLRQVEDDPDLFIASRIYVPIRSKAAVDAPKYFLVMHELDVGAESLKETTFILIKGVHPSRRLVKELFCQLRRDGVPTRALLNALGPNVPLPEIAPDYIVPPPVPIPERELSDHDQELLNKHAIKIHQVVEDVFNDISRSPLLCGSMAPSAGCLPNIFFTQKILSNTRRRRYGVVSVCGFDYTLRMVLPEAQRRAIVSHMGMIVPEQCFAQKCRLREYPGLDRCLLEEMTPEEFCRFLEAPIGPDGRAMADHTISSGVIDFSSEIFGTGRSKPSHIERVDPVDQMQLKTMLCLFSQLSRTPHVFSIPVRVGGSSFFVISHVMDGHPGNKEDTDVKKTEETWLNNYHYYHTIRSKVSREARKGMILAYLASIESVLDSSLFPNNVGLSLQDRLDEANDALQKLTLLYPFDGIRLFVSRKQDDVESYKGGTYRLLPLVMNQQLSLSFHENRNFNRQIDNLKFQVHLKITKACKAVVIRKREELATVSSTRFQEKQRTLTRENINALVSDLQRMGSTCLPCLIVLGFVPGQVVLDTIIQMFNNWEPRHKVSDFDSFELDCANVSDEVIRIKLGERFSTDDNSHDNITLLYPSSSRLSFDKNRLAVFLNIDAADVDLQSDILNSQRSQNNDHAGTKFNFHRWRTLFIIYSRFEDIDDDVKIRLSVIPNIVNIRERVTPAGIEWLESLGNPLN